MNPLKLMAMLMFCTIITYTADKPVATKKTTDPTWSGIAFIGAGTFGLRGMNKDERAAKKIEDDSKKALLAKINEHQKLLGLKPLSSLPSFPQPQPRLRWNRVPFWGSTLFGAYLLSKGLLAKYYPNNWIMPTKLRTNRVKSKGKNVYNRKHRDLSTMPSALFRSL
jgi:hypothetical protein